MQLTNGDKINLLAAYHFFVGGIFALLAIAALVVPLAAVALGESEFLARLPGWFLGSSLLIVAIVLGGIALPPRRTVIIERPSNDRFAPIV